MKNFHHCDEKNPLDFLIAGAYILNQTLGRIVRRLEEAASRRG
jgi:hypothetical protein